MHKCKRCLVSGRVQGVFFRASTQQIAEELGLVGYAKNLPDRRVEVLACGPEAALKELTDWLWQGPRLAEVTDLVCEAVDLNQYPDTFSTG
jgi:acylphosphatase